MGQNVIDEKGMYCTVLYCASLYSKDLLASCPLIYMIRQGDAVQLLKTSFC